MIPITIMTLVLSAQFCKREKTKSLILMMVSILECEAISDLQTDQSFSSLCFLYLDSLSSSSFEFTAAGRALISALSGCPWHYSQQCQHFWWFSQSSTPWCVSWISIKDWRITSSPPKSEKPLSRWSSNHKRHLRGSCWTKDTDSTTYCPFLYFLYNTLVIPCTYRLDLQIWWLNHLLDFLCHVLAFPFRFSTHLLPLFGW